METLGEYLRQCRENLGMALDAVAAKSGIKAQLLKFLEESIFLKLPPDVYVIGFLKKLSVLYRVEAGPLIDQYKKERGISVQLKQRHKEDSSLWHNIFGGVIVTPKILSLMVGVLFTILTLGYIIYEVYSINRTPSLVIFEPQDRQIVKDSFVNIRGKTDSGITVSINDQEIFVDTSGDFKTQLGITPGPRDLKIVARNKFDKEAVKIVSVVAESSSSSELVKGLELKLDFTADVKLNYKIDSQPEQILTFHKGDSKLLLGERKIIISTTDAGATKVSLNGQALNVLGRPHEVLSNIPFFADAEGVK